MEERSVKAFSNLFPDEYMGFVGVFGSGYFESIFYRKLSKLSKKHKDDEWQLYRLKFFFTKLLARKKRKELHRYVKQLEDYMEHDGSLICDSCGWDSGKWNRHWHQIEYINIIEAIYFDDKKLNIGCDNKDDEDCCNHRGFDFYFE